VTLRIALVIARLNIGGPATHVIALAAALAKRDFEVRLLTGRMGAGEQDMHYLADAAGVVPEILPELSPRLGLQDAAGLARLWRIFRDWKPDVVHTHTAKAGALGRLAARAAGVPAVVHTFHGHVLRGYFPAPVEMGFRMAERTLALATDAIITLSPSLRRELVEMRIAPAERIEVIPLGMDLDALIACRTRRMELRHEIGLGNEAVLIGIVGRLVPIKDHATFLEAAAGMVHSGNTARFLVVGDGPLRESLAEQAAKLGISERVTFLGWRQNMAQVYAALDVLALTSRNEGTPVTILEAMAAGVPVAATAVGGVPDVISDGRTGWLVPAQDSIAMVAAWKSILGDPARSQRIAQQAQADVQMRFSQAHMIEDISALYKRLMSRKAHG
jgi:glycosyltransferase involved in cell wall biosynthesis